MKLRLAVVGICVACALPPEVHAQFLPYPQPVVVSGNGVGFVYSRRNLVVAGSIGTRAYVVPGYYDPFAFRLPIAPYGIQQNRIVIQVINPRPIFVVPTPEETQGIDLDLLPPKKAPPAPEMEPAPKPKREPEPPPKMPGVDVSKPKKVERPAEKPAPKEEELSQFELGMRAFQEQSYGLAALRFRQAIALDPGMARAYFLLGQSEFALSKYHDAVKSLEAGLRLQKNWPSQNFAPRKDLYAGSEMALDEQLKRLEGVFAAQPQDANFGFLLAYQYWFDGQRKDAVALFRQVRPLTADTRYIDQFLTAAAPGVVAKR